MISAGQKSLRPLSRIAASVAVLAVLAPILVVIFSWGSDQTEIWQHLIATQLSSLLRNTLVLLMGVGLCVSVLGISLAWLVVMCDFPGRAKFEWLLMLPMAVPAYVLAFVVLGLFDFSGPLQSFLSRELGLPLIDVRHEAVVVLVLSLVLYPYVYMLARSAFLSQSSDTIEAARSLGSGAWGAFFRVALPMARPAIIAGVSLALMETLADFGTVAVFNYDTFTTAIYKAWFGFFSLQAAAQLASLLLLFVALTLFAEKRLRGRRRYVQGSQLHHHFRHPLTGLRAWAVTAYCLLVLSVAFFLPVLQMLIWAFEVGAAQLDARFGALLWHSLSLALQASVLTVAIATLLAFSRWRAGPRQRAFFDLAQLGYALPGSVLAVGVVISFSRIEQQLLFPLQAWLGMEARSVLVGTVLALLAAYWIRFLAVASGPIDASLLRIRPSIPDAARTLGARPLEVLWRIYLPMLRPGLLTAAILVFVDVIKEMPATLLLRPYGWDTLAVRIYEMTSEGEWQRAALPALTIVLLGLVPVIISIKRTLK
ncbi:ABC transporter permease [Litorivivens lipolytica]|uniref:ABC transporter permease n=1 Tax=Litorivivens lipolytica TaxID=1524264 RepID=UPI003CCD00BC